MKSGRRKYKLRTYILSCIERKNKKRRRFFNIYIFFPRNKMFSNAAFKNENNNNNKKSSFTCFVSCPLFLSSVVKC